MDCFAGLRSGIGDWALGLQAAAGVQAGLRVDGAGGARRGGVSTALRAVPLSNNDAWNEWAGVAGDYENESHALGRAAYG